MTSELHGWLTPWAEILCSDCLDKPDLVHKDLSRVAEANCDRCGRTILIDKPLAMEQKLAKALRANGIEASVWQTGGMVSSTGYRVNGYEIMANWGEEHPANDPTGDYFMVSVLGSDGQDAEPSLFFRSIEETVAFFKEAIGRYGTGT